MADIFRRHGAAFRQAHAGHLDRDQRRVIGAITVCRTAALGGHVEQCDNCGLTRIPYNSCRNRHCPKCQGTVRLQWLAARQAELLPVPYFHVVFTPAVLHTWGQTLQHHPHLHCVVPGGGIAPDGHRWLTCRPSFFLPVGALARLFRRLFLRGLRRAFDAATLHFFGDFARLAEPPAFTAWLNELRRIDWVVYAKPSFGGPAQVLAYLGRYTHRVAIANSRLITLLDSKVTFSWTDHRHHGSRKATTLAADEFIRRFLLHTLPDGFHRIRYYGFLANGSRGDNIARCRGLLAERELSAVSVVAVRRGATGPIISCDFTICPLCGGSMRRVATVPRVCSNQPFRCDTS